MTTRETTTPNVEELTTLDHAGVNRFSTLFAFAGIDESPLRGHGDEAYRVLAEFLKDPELRVYARFLGAVLLEHQVWGGRKSGQDDPPVGGFLGKAIDQVIEELTPLVAARAPEFFNFIESEDWEQ